MKNLTWQNPEQLFVAQELINKVKSKCCGIKVNDEIPSEKDFENTMADYLTFEFNMMTHGRGYLFEEKGGSDGKAN